MNADDGSVEVEYDEGGLGLMHEVHDPPRTVAATLVAALGVLVVGVGAASGWAIVAGEPPLDEYARRAAGLGLTPGVLLIGGTLLAAVGGVGSSVLRALRRTVDLLEVAPDPVPLLQDLDHSNQRLHISLVATEQNVQRSVREALDPLAQRLDSLEAALEAASASLDSDEQTPSDAIWRLAASMDQIRAQLDARLAEQLKSFEAHMAGELARATEEHVSALEDKLRTTETRLAAEVGAAAELAQTAAARTAAPPVASAPAPAPAVVASEPAAAAPTPVHAAPAPVAAPAPPASVEPVGPTPREVAEQLTSAVAAERPAPVAQAPPRAQREESLGLFDQIDDQGHPHGHEPTRHRDIYAEPPPTMSVDDAPAVRPADPSRATHDEHLFDG